MQFKKLDRALVLLLLLALAVRVPFLFIVPMVEAPDEFAHFWVTKFLSEHFAAPDAAQIAAGGPSAVYGSLPPFAYLPHVLFAWLIPNIDISFTERIGSILGGLITVFAALKISRMIFAGNRTMLLALPLATALHPQLAFVNAYCNSDSTAMALSSLLILLSFKVVFEGARIRYAAAAGVLSALIALSKFSALAVVPVAFFAIAAACRVYKLNAAQTSMRLAIAALVAAGISLPWFARNAAVFSGDWLGTNTMRLSWAKTFNRSIEPVSIVSVLKQKVWWQQLFCSFWAVYGYQKHYLPLVFYIGYLLLIVTAAAGILTQLSRGIKNKSVNLDFIRRIDEGEGELVKHYAAWLCLGLSALLSCAGLLYAAAQNLGGPQGRYLFPSEIAFLSVIILALGSFGRMWGKWLVCAFVGWNACTLFYSMIMLYTMFGVRLKTY